MFDLFHSILYIFVVQNGYLVSTSRLAACVYLRKEITMNNNKIYM